MEELPDVIYLISSSDAYEGIVWSDDYNPEDLSEDEINAKQYISTDYIYNLLQDIDNQREINQSLKDLRDALGETEILDS